jgi:uncharacterized protein (TIGR02147 family)
MDVFNYSDYRQFLSDAYAERHSKDRRFSYRYIAQKAGFASAGFFTNVLKGKKDISLTLAMRLADVFGLSPRQRQYFEQLVQFNKSHNEIEKQEHLKRLRALRGRAAKSLVASQSDFYSKWQYTAIREALALKPFKGDYKALGETLNPPLSPTEARTAVELLLELGLLRKIAGGSVERCDPNLTSSDEIASSVLVDLQLQMMGLAKQALEQLPKNQRNFSTLTLSISPSTYASIIEELRSFRKRILTMAAESQDPDRVIQMNFQVFPLTKVEPKA